MPTTTSSSSTAVTSEPIESAWRQFVNVLTWEGIGPVGDVSDPVVENDELVSFRWVTHAAGGKYPGTATISTWKHLVTIGIDISSTEVSGTITMVTSRVEDGTQLDVTVFARPEGLLASLFFPAIARAIENGLPGQVEDFAHRLVTQADI